MKNVIVISTSLRPGSNSHALAEQFAKGAEAAGHQVELVSLRGKEIKFCIGCLSCQKTGACVIKDDNVRNKIKVIVAATNALVTWLQQVLVLVDHT